MLLERSVGGELLAARDVASWDAAGGRPHQQRRGLRADGRHAAGGAARSASRSRSRCPGGGSGVLAVADKESRDGRVLDFTPTDARLLSLFANQAAAAIETARLHKDAIEKERIERELELAAAIQRQILPRDLPARRGAGDRGARTCPTRQVGGDYFDFFPLSGGRLAFLVADVSGKGVPAALLVSTVHAAVHLQIDEAKTIADLVGRIDRHLQRYAATRKFLTRFFGLLEPGHGHAAVRVGGPQSRAAAPAPAAPSSSSRRRASRSGCFPTPPGGRRRSRWRRATCSASTPTASPRRSTRRTRSSASTACRRLMAADAARRDLRPGLRRRRRRSPRDVPQYDDQTLILLRRSSSRVG